jgi:hypothetical protein
MFLRRILFHKLKVNKPVVRDKAAAAASAA